MSYDQPLARDAHDDAEAMRRYAALALAAGR